MDGWLEWFEERCAILEFDSGMTRTEAEAKVTRIAIAYFKKTGERPSDLIESDHKFRFYGLLQMGTRFKGDVEVVEYRWRHHDGYDRVTLQYYTEEEAHRTFGARWHEKVDETRRAGKRAVY